MSRNPATQILTFERFGLAQRSAKSRQIRQQVHNVEKATQEVVDFGRIWSTSPDKFGQCPNSHPIWSVSPDWPKPQTKRPGWGQSSTDERIILSPEICSAGSRQGCRSANYVAGTVPRTDTANQVGCHHPLHQATRGTSPDSPNPSMHPRQAKTPMTI